MTVAELIADLSKFDPGLQVYYCHYEEDPIPFR